MYSLVYAVILRPYPYRDPDALVRVESRHIKQGGALQGSSLLDVEDYRRRTTTLVDIGAYYAFETQLVGDGPSEVATIAQLNPAALNILGVRPVLGRLLRPEEDVAGGAVHSARSRAREPFVRLQLVGGDYFRAKRIPLHRGRLFERTDDPRADVLTAATLPLVLVRRP